MQRLLRMFPLEIGEREKNIYDFNIIVKYFNFIFFQVSHLVFKHLVSGTHFCYCNSNRRLYRYTIRTQSWLLPMIGNGITSIAKSFQSAESTQHLPYQKQYLSWNVQAFVGGNIFKSRNRQKNKKQQHIQKHKQPRQGSEL